MQDVNKIKTELENSNQQSKDEIILT